MLEQIATILPIVMVITEFVKKRLKLDGWVVIAVSVIISAGGMVYVDSVQDLTTTEMILLGIATAVSANGGYDLLKEVVGFIKE